MDIIYYEKISDFHGNRIDDDILKQTFRKAIAINNELVLNHKRVAYFFIDPLINNFEAANDFYFNIFNCGEILKINTYKSGASPIQAITDAKELIDNGLYDAVFIFGKELLLSNTKRYGKAEIKKAMSIFENNSILECYNQIAYRLSNIIGISKEEFINISDMLYENYIKAYVKTNNIKFSIDRGGFLEGLKADLFKLTDCANPNVDFSGGIILTSEETSNFLQIPNENRIKVKGSKYSMIKGLPENIDSIVGEGNNIFPHLKRAMTEAQKEANIKVSEELLNNNLLLEVYTCYPPIPIAFLFASEIVKDIDEIPELLNNYNITVSGGLNVARAPWNNPALNGLIDLCKQLKTSKERLGLVHGNGGIGEVQGVTILECCENELNQSL